MVSHSLFLWFLPASSPYDSNASGAGEFQETDIKILLEKYRRNDFQKVGLFIGLPASTGDMVRSRRS
jgi:hypothetical protein